MIAFFLGSHPEVSLAELRLLLDTKEVARLSTFALFDITPEVAAEVFPVLGGMPRYGIVVATLTKAEGLEEQVITSLIAELKSLKKKEYVVSLLGVTIDKRKLHHDLKERLPGVKYDGSFTELQHMPATVHHIMERGGNEFVLTPYQGSYLFIKTINVQDPKYWTMVDMERPGRDMHIGMLPAKLALIMVNMSGVTSEGRLWDPFVGQATIAMQAAGWGISVYGTDISRASLDIGKQNMAWAINKKLVKHGLVVLKEQAIERPETDIEVTAIATEPLLGKPRFKPFSGEFLAQREWKTVEKLYIQLLRVATASLHPGERLVCIKPTFSYIAEGLVRWYNPPLSIPADSWKVPEIIADLGPLLWIQRDSVVGREVLILEKR